MKVRSKSEVQSNKNVHNRNNYTEIKGGKRRVRREYYGRYIQM